MGVVHVVRGFLICAAWYYTIISGFFILYCPVMYLIIFNHKLYRQIIDIFFALWELYPVALFQWCHKMHIHHYGDHVHPDEKIIIVMNHRTRVDWNYLWIALYHATQRLSHNEVAGNPTDTKIISRHENKFNYCSILKENIWEYLGGKSKIKLVLKDEIKTIPALGWIMQLNYFLYVKRNWSEDEQNMKRFLEYYYRMNANFRLVLFPEGTDLSEDNKRRSDRYAFGNNLPSYNYVLHPRTTGWAMLCSQLLDLGLDAVYDVTVAYDRPAQTEKDLLFGHLAEHAYFYFKRYPIEKLPTHESALRNWLNERWQEKEINLRSFHDNGVFTHSTENETPKENQPRPLRVALWGFVFWNVINGIFMYLLLCSSLFQFWVIYHSLLFAFVTSRFGGFHNLQYELLENRLY